MEMLTTSFFWVTLAQITMINILLSGDNAVVIALASRSLPPTQQKQAILFGSFGAIILRIVLTFFAVYLLELPYLKIVGALLLIWIGIKMLIPDDEEAKLDAHAGLWAAVKTIIVADLVMSLDNVLGVAAAAKGNVPLLVIGLVISIPLIIYGSTLILKLMNRFSFIVTVGGGLLGWVAGEMLISDPALSGWVNSQLAEAHTGAPMLATFLVVGSGKWFSMNRGAGAEAAAYDFAPPSMQSAGAGIVSGAGASAALALEQDFAEAIDPIPERQAITRRATADAGQDEPPPGYRWTSILWHTLADGKRDYALMHGRKSFRSLAPVSSHLRPPPRVE